MTQADFMPLLLPLLAVAATVLVIVMDLFLPERRGASLGWLTAALLGGLLVVSFYVPTTGVVGDGVFVGTAWSVFFARLSLVAALLAVLGALEHVERRFPRRQGEYYALLLSSVVGMLILPGARDVLLLVVAFELMGIPLYVLAAYAKSEGMPLLASEEPGSGKKSPAAEAAIKLYLVGATSTAITLFGLALVVGVAGTTEITGLLGDGPLAPLTRVGMMLVLGGMSFKIGLVPFHMWVPDTYQGAPTPFVAFLSVAPKATGIAAFVSLFVIAPAAHGGAHGPWIAMLLVLATASMVIGNLAAVPQSDVRRLLGFSGVAQMGYVLLAIATGTSEGLSMAAFFLAAYVVTNMGVFFVIHACAAEDGRHDLASLAGLSQRAPFLGFALLVFLLSLAGIPFAVGFWAKLYVFLAAFRAGYVWLVALGAVLAVIGLFYYMQVARAAFMKDDASTGAPAPTIGVGLRAAVLLCLVGVLGLGLWPALLFDQTADAGTSILETRAP
ncbi:MAG: NADH-quinone oxidoreductase subunit N [Sandaracinaceae bacterium]|nr:NADH-quinone oxidoreductase subunit N [Sandaracinaceae bacterium]